MISTGSRVDMLVIQKKDVDIKVTHASIFSCQTGGEEGLAFGMDKERQRMNYDVKATVKKICYGCRKSVLQNSKGVQPYKHLFLTARYRTNLHILT